MNRRLPPRVDTCRHVWNYCEQIAGYLATRWCVHCELTEYSDDGHKWTP